MPTSIQHNTDVKNQNIRSDTVSTNRNSYEDVGYKFIKLKWGLTKN